MERITPKIDHLDFEKIKFATLSTIHKLQKGDCFIVAILRNVDEGKAQVETHSGITPSAARWLFLSLFENPEMRRAASFVLSSFKKMSAEEIQELLEALDASMAEEENAE